MDEIRRLIVKEVDHTLNAKISVILQGANKTFLAMHLLDDSGYGIVKLLNYEQPEYIQDKFIKLSLPNVSNLVALSSIMQGVVILITSLK